MGGGTTGTVIVSDGDFVVETGSGLATANSYVSETDADAYHSLHTSAADWDGATVDEKRRALILATQYLDNMYHCKWRGVRANRDQALDWPRSGVWDDDEFSLDSDVIPTKLAQATAEAALRVVLGDELLPALASGSNIQSETKSVGKGAASKSITYFGQKDSLRQYPLIERLLSSLVDNVSYVIRG